MNLSKKMTDMKDALISLDFSGMRDDDSWNLKHKNIGDIVDLLMDAYFPRTRNQYKVSTRKKSLINVIYYLFFIEGIYSFDINMIIYYEICNKSQEIKIDYGKNRDKKVTNFDELNDVRLSNRLKFMKKRGYGEIADLCNVKIRNAIAHNDYYIDGKGAVIIVSNREKINYSTLNEYIGNLQLFMSFFNTSYMRAKYSES